MTNVLPRGGKEMSSFWAAHDKVHKRKKDTDGAAGSGSHGTVFSCVHLIQPSFDDITLYSKLNGKNSRNDATGEPLKELRRRQSEPEFFNFSRAQQLIPRNQFRQPI